ncbi:MAG: nucleotidyltransferase family protein [Phycisphaerae bacterium]|nr:nucleotidyltransferase family protein [Phycisphaerae bacterium]
MQLPPDLHQHRESILRIAQSRGARRIRVFGSVARGDAHPGSDLDLLVDLEPGRSILDQVGLQLELQDLLGRRVDIVVEGGLSPYLVDRIEREARAL